MAKTKFYSSDQNCCVTGTTPVDLHHVKTRGAGGKDTPDNLMPLAHYLHVEVGMTGMVAFAEKYEGAKKWLRENNWEMCPVRKRWA